MVFYIITYHRSTTTTKIKGKESKATLPALISASPQYEKLMDKLSDDEKYNILLQSRASTLIDILGGRAPRSSPSSDIQQEFEPLYKLMEEMTAKKVKLTNKSFASLVDAASLSRNLGVIQACLVLARRNGVCRAFSRDIGGVAMPPSTKNPIAVEGRLSFRINK